MLNQTLRWVAVVALCASTAAFAQARGRTDGPEGSEYGKGGYQAAGGGKFSLALDWGAALDADGAGVGGARAGPPLFLGGTASYWADEWFVMDLSASYLFSSGKTNLLIGPRLRTGYFPVSASLGLQAGMIWIPDTGVRFGLSPSLGADVLISDKLLLGLALAVDLPLGGGGAAWRPHMTVGYRF
jgi:hypothetical protein